MKCHYEVLGVPRTAGPEELKNAHRKLALKWHPDKNLENPQEAKQQFLLVQQAYEVLSDPNEKKWYDEYREQILRSGSGTTYINNSVNIFKYFSPSCFKGFGDDERGFYSIYRVAFHKLYTEDLPYLTESDTEYPTFGYSSSNYEEVVHPFYAFWQSYSTKCTYSWLTPFNVRQRIQKGVYRVMFKETKKLQDMARKTRNEKVQKLAEFVRKRDKRVQEHIQHLKQKSIANTKKAEEIRMRQIKDKNENLLENYQESSCSKFSNVESELQVIESHTATTFRDTNSFDEENSSDSTSYPDTESSASGQSNIDERFTDSRVGTEFCTSDQSQLDTISTEDSRDIWDFSVGSKSSKSVCSDSDSHDTTNTRDIYELRCSMTRLSLSDELMSPQDIQSTASLVPVVDATSTRLSLSDELLSPQDIQSTASLVPVVDATSSGGKIVRKKRRANKTVAVKSKGLTQAKSKVPDVLHKK